MLKKHRGELFLILGALTFSVNGIFSTVVLQHMSAFRLAQIRAISAFAILFLFALIFSGAISGDDFGPHIGSLSFFK